MFLRVHHHHLEPFPHSTQFFYNGLRRRRFQTKPRRSDALHSGPGLSLFVVTLQTMFSLVSGFRGKYCKASASFPIKSHQGRSFQLAGSAHHPTAAQVQYVSPPPSPLCFRFPPSTSHLPIVNLSRAITLPVLGQPQHCISVLIYSCKAPSAKAGLPWSRGSAEKVVRPSDKCTRTANFLQLQESKFSHSPSSNTVKHELLP